MQVDVAMGESGCLLGFGTEAKYFLVLKSDPSDRVFSGGPILSYGPWRAVFKTYGKHTPLFLPEHFDSSLSANHYTNKILRIKW